MYANDAQMPGPAVHRRKEKNRTRDAAALAAGGGVAYAGVQAGKAAKKIGKAADRTAEAVEHANVAARKGGKFLRGARRQLTTFPTFKKIVKRFMSSAVEPVELGKGPSVGQDRYRKQIDEKDHEKSLHGYGRAAETGGGIGALVAKKGGRRKAALIGAAAGLAAQTIVRSGTSHTKDQYGERSRTGKAVDKVPAAAGAATAAGLLIRKATKHKLRKFLSRRMNAAIELAEGADVAVRVGKSAGGRVGAWFKKRWTTAPAAARAAVVGAGALGGAGAVAGAVAPEKDESRVQSSVGHAAKDAVFGGALYGVTEPLLKKATGADAEGALKATGKKAAKKIVKALGTKLGARLIELRAVHHSDDESRDHGGKFKDSVKGYIEKDRNYKGATSKLTDKPVRNSILRKANDVRRVGGRAGRLASDVADHVQGKRKTDERGRPKKREWEKTYFKNGVQNVAIAGGLAVGAHHLKNHPEHYREAQAIKRGVTGQKTTGKRNPTTGKMVYKKVAAPKTRVGKGIVKTADKVKGGVKKIGKMLFSAGTFNRLVELDYYDRADWDLRDPRGKSARVFAPGSKTRTRRPKKFHEKAGNQRKLGVAAVAAGTAIGALLGRKSGVKKGIRETEKRLAPAVKKAGRKAPNKGMQRVTNHDGTFYTPRSPKKK